MIVSHHPFPHLIADDLFPPALLAEAARTWPASEWPGWISYDPRYEHKRASDLRTPIPVSCGELLHLMAALPLATWLDVPPVLPDLGLYGAGLHECPPGEGVSLHLDADRHARLGLERRLSASLYVHPEWRPEWGGQLELWKSRDVVGPRLKPWPGRLIAFATGEQSYHAVAPVTGPQPRRSLALFCYGRATQRCVRPRAHFVSPDAGER